MPYFYTDPTRESDPTALPDCEVFHAETLECQDCGVMLPHSPEGAYPEACPDCGCAEYGPAPEGSGYWYAHGIPGCLYDSDPIGPFESESEAIQAACDAAEVY